MHSSKVTPMLGDPETKYHTDPDGDSVTEISLHSPDKHHLGGAARMPQATRRLSKRWSSMPPDEQERIQEQAKRFGGVNEETKESFKSLLTYSTEDHQTTEAPSKPKKSQVSVPVALTLMIKAIEAEGSGDDQKVILSGTMIHRALFLDLRRVLRSDRDSDEGPKYFQIRLNEGLEAEGITERKCVLSPLDVVDKFSGTGAKSIFNACCTTLSFQLPLKRETVFNMQPFQISTCEILLELTSFTGTVHAESLDTYDTISKLAKKLKLGGENSAQLCRHLEKEDVKLDLLRPRSDATIDAWLKELGLGVQDRATFINALRSNSEIDRSDECVPALPRPRMLRT